MTHGSTGARHETWCPTSTARAYLEFTIHATEAPSSVERVCNVIGCECERLAQHQPITVVVANADRSGYVDTLVARLQRDEHIRTQVTRVDSERTEIRICAGGYCDSEF